MTTDNTQDRDEVAAATGVPAKLLRGDTRAELEHHASQLADAGITDAHFLAVVSTGSNT